MAKATYRKQREFGFYTVLGDGSLFHHGSVSSASRHPSSRYGIFVLFGTKGGPRRKKLTKADINYFLDAEKADRRRAARRGKKRRVKRKVRKGRKGRRRR